MTKLLSLSRVLPAEWERQDAIVVAWPHRGTDWHYMLSQAQQCFKNVAAAIVKEMRLIVVAPDAEAVRRQLSDLENGDNIIYVECETNDTWARDFGPISVVDDGKHLMLDFKFNAWGMKFPSCHDNLTLYDKLRLHRERWSRNHSHHQPVPALTQPQRMAQQRRHRRGFEQSIRCKESAVA